MNRDFRITILTKLAKKKKDEGLTGQHNRKSVEKHLSKTKDTYFGVSSKLKQFMAEAERVNKIISELSELQSASKDQMKKCHEILSCMDLNNGVDKVSVKDGQVYYLINNKLHTYDNGSHEFIPHRKSKIEDFNDLSYVDDEDLLKLDDDSSEEEVNNLDEGYSVNKVGE